MSFGAELKDFVNAYKAGNDINKSNLTAERSDRQDAEAKRWHDLQYAYQTANINQKNKDADLFNGFRAQAPVAGGPDAAGAPSPIHAAIWNQETNSNSNAHANTSGATGIGQVTPATFAQWAKPGEDINNPVDSKNVSARIISAYAAKYGNDPARIATAYFSGPGNVAPAGSPTPWIKDTNDGHKSVSGYVADITDRLNGNDPSKRQSNKPGQVQPAPLAAPAPAQAGAPAPVASDDTGALPIDQMAAKGGLIRRFADGGPVSAGPAIPTDEQGGDQNNGQYWTQQAQQQPQQQPQQPQQQPQQDDHSSAFANLGQALHAGLMQTQKAFGLSGGDGAVDATDPATAAANERRLTHTTEGAAAPEEYTAVRKAIDPGNKLNDSLANIYALSKVYEYYDTHGEYDKASKAVASLMRYTQSVSSAYAGTAIQQAQAGNMPGAVAALQKSYDYIPDGNHLEATPPGADGKGTYVQRDSATGKVLAQGTYTPQQLIQMAGAAQNGSAYWQHVMRAAKTKDDDDDKGISQSEFQAALAGKGAVPAAPAAPAAPAGSTPAAPAPAAPPPAAPAAANTADDSDDSDDSDESDTATAPAATAPAATAGASAASTSGGNPAGAAPFDVALYSRMNKEQRAGYLAARKQLQSEAKPPKPEKPEKPPSRADLKSVSDDVGEALKTAIGPAMVDPKTLNKYGDADTAIKGMGQQTFNDIRDLGSKIAFSHNLPGDTAANIALQLAGNIDPEDPTATTFKVVGVDPKTKVATVKMANGSQVKLTQPMQQQLLAIREHLLSQFAEGADAREADSKVSWPDRMRQAGHTIIGSIPDLTREYKPERSFQRKARSFATQGALPVEP